MSLAPVEAINPEQLAPPGGHYTHGTVANGFVFVSGQLPISASGEKLSAATFAEQAQLALKNVAAVLQACGAGIQDLVQVRVYVDDIANWPEFNQIYARWAGDARPSRAVVPTGRLHYGLKIEVEAIALARQGTAA